MKEYLEIIRQKGLPEVGQTVRSKKYGTLWRTMEKREVWQNIEPDPKTGRRALYRDETTHTIHNDASRCIGCGSCAEACAGQRTGVIHIDSATERPQGICTLCGGDPQCVKWCPFEALSYVEVRADRKFYSLGPEKIAAELAMKWYGTADFGGLK